MKKKNRCFSFVEYTSSNGQKKVFYSSFKDRKYFSSIHDVFIRTKELDIFDPNINMSVDIRLLYFLYESMYDELLIEEDIFMFETFEELKLISTTGEAKWMKANLNLSQVKKNILF